MSGRSISEMNIKTFVLSLPQTIDTGIIAGVKEALFTAYNVADTHNFDNSILKLQSLRSSACKEIAQYNLFPCDKIDEIDRSVSCYCCNLNLLVTNSKYMKNFGQIMFSWIGLFTDELVNSNLLSFEIANCLLVIVIINLNFAIKHTTPTRKILNESLLYIQRARSAINYMFVKKYTCENYEYLTPIFLEALNLIIELVEQHITIGIIEHSTHDKDEDDNDNDIFIQLTEYSFGMVDLCKKTKNKLIRVVKFYPAFSLPKSWFIFCDVGYHYYHAMALYYFAKSMNIMHDSSKMVTCLSYSLNLFESAMQLAKNTKADCLSSLQNYYEKIKQYHKEVDSDNKNVYFRLALPTLDGITLPHATFCGKNIQFSFLKENESSFDLFNIFNTLFSNTDSSSDYAPYKTMLENLKNSTQIQVNKSDIQLEEFLNRINVSTIMDIKNGRNQSLDTIKTDILTLKTTCWSMEALEKNLNIHMNLSQNNATKFHNLLEELYQKLNFIDISMKDSIIKKKDSIETALTQAAQIDCHLKSTFDQHKLEFQFLFSPIEKIMSTIPSVEKVLTSNITKNSLKIFEEIMEKVEQMKSQRTRFLNELIDSINNDNFNSKIHLIDKASHSLHFKEHLKKYGHPINVLKQNIAAQANIIEALQNAYNKCLDSMDEINSIIYQQDNRITQIKTTIEIYTKINNEIRDGLELHRKIDLLIRNLTLELAKTNVVQQPPPHYYQSKNYYPQHQSSSTVPSTLSNLQQYNYEIPSRSLKPTNTNQQYPPQNNYNYPNNFHDYNPNNPYPRHQ